MYRALNTSATGMEAQELKMDLIANNLANINTTGFKKVRGEFQDLLYETQRPSGTNAADGSEAPVGVQVGQGVRSVATLRNFGAGSVRQTDNPLDLAVEGKGFFRMRMANGTQTYTRDGSFKKNAQGEIVNSDGNVLADQIIIPETAKSIMISSDGTVTATVAGQTEPINIGTIRLATFANEAGLDALGHNMFAETDASGTAIITSPGEEGIGAIAQGFLEMSNVKVVEEMIELITTQRAYETNSKVIKAADEMLAATARLG